MDCKITLIPGDGIGPEIVREAVKVLDAVGKAILEKERNGTKVFKAENDKEYYRQQMDNARTTSNRHRTAAIQNKN